MANMNFNPTWNSNSFSPYSNPYYNQNFRSYQSQLNTQQQQQQFYPSTSTGQNNIFWVEGKENARSMQLQPNSTMLLMDSEVGKFYIKTTDDIGLGKLRIFKYTEEIDTEEKPSNKTQPIDLSDYVTKDELNNIIKEIKNSEQFISRTEQTKQPTSVSTKQQFSSINTTF